MPTAPRIQNAKTYLSLFRLRKQLKIPIAIANPQIVARGIKTKQSNSGEEIPKPPTRIQKIPPNIARTMPTKK
jgi:hypothetical protein